MNGLNTVGELEIQTRRRQFNGTRYTREMLRKDRSTAHLVILLAPATVATSVDPPPRVWPFRGRALKREEDGQ